MIAYKTYVMGAEASMYFDREIVAHLKDNMFWWRMSYRYRSIWRTLHIDGLEGYIWNRQELPKFQPGRYQFFQYATNNAKPQPELLTSATEIGGGYVGAEIDRSEHR